MKTKQHHHLNLLFDIGELSELIAGSPDIKMFLQQAVDLVAGHFNAPVCSIYLYNNQKDILVLKATRGLNPKAVDQICMKPGEGLVGFSFKENRIIREPNAAKHPKFKYFNEAGEEPFNSLLCLPVRHGGESIGVLVIQHREKNYFDESDEMAIRTAGTQLAGAIENARLLMALHQKKKEPLAALPGLIRGESFVKGFAKGRVVQFKADHKNILYKASAREAACTKEQFPAAVEKTQKRLRQLQQNFAARLPESAALIFTAHFMILKDKNFIGKMRALIDAGMNPCKAVRTVAGSYISLFSSSPSPHMKEKVQDIEDLAIRILRNLRVGKDRSPVRENAIVIAGTIYPSDVLKLLSEGAGGIILTGSGAASHVTILCRSLNLPLIRSSDADLQRLEPTDTVLMDADIGNIYINPDRETITAFKRKEKAKKNAYQKITRKRTATMDNRRVHLYANINLLGELPLAESYHAQGIGLYRTEFPFLIRDHFPSETEQFQIYKQLLDGFGSKGPVTIRTLDAGGEKSLSYSKSPGEANPEMGLRSIRFSLKYKDVFETQIRAILRAADGRKNVRIMFPFISSLDEFRTAKAIVSECMNELEKKGQAFQRDIETGLMIELPGVLSVIDAFAREADFFSIGTNDFIQYMVAADRTNALVGDYYQACHPAVLKGLDMIARAARHHKIDICICGEMAHTPEYIPFLLGLGIDTLSIDPQFFPDVQQKIEMTTLQDALAYSKLLLMENTIAGTRSVIDRFKSSFE